MILSQCEFLLEGVYFAFLGLDDGLELLLAIVVHYVIS